MIDREQLLKVKRDIEKNLAVGGCQPEHVLINILELVNALLGKELLDGIEVIGTKRNNV